MKNDDEPALDGFTFTLTRKELRKLKAEAWQRGYREGAEDNREEYGRRVRWGTTTNPYKDDS